MKLLLKHLDQLADALGHAIVERVAPAIGTRIQVEVARALRELASELRTGPRTCGVLVIGETAELPFRERGFRRRHGLDELLEPDMSEWHAPAVPIVRPFLSGKSFALRPQETVRETFPIHQPTRSGALIIAWGACVLVDATVGTESCARWPGSSPVFQTPRTANPGTLIGVLVEGVQL